MKQRMNMMQVPADDNCLAHVFVAAKDAVAFMRGRNASGHVQDPERTAQDAKNAQAMRERVWPYAGLLVCLRQRWGTWLHGRLRALKRTRPRCRS